VFVQFPQHRLPCIDSARLITEWAVSRPAPPISSPTGSTQEMALCAGGGVPRKSLKNF
jgi:hypothetical protein